MKANRFIQFITYSSLLLLGGCEYNDISKQSFDCNTSTLSISLDSKQDASNCKAIDGSITLLASGGLAPYSFSLNDGEFQTHPEFTDLGSGTYMITVKDDNNCERSVEVNVEAANSTLEATYTASADTECLTDNGSVTITASGGNGPYKYGWASGTFVTSNVIGNLKSGNYSVIVKDANDCQKIVSVLIPRGNTGISFDKEIKPILTANCTFSSCHGAGNGARDWTVFANVKDNAANIKTRTGNRSMPIGGGSLTQEQINKIACWVDDGANSN